MRGKCTLKGDTYVNGTLEAAQDGGHRSKEDGLEQAGLADKDSQQLLVNDDEVREGITDRLSVRGSILSRFRHAVNVVLSHADDLLEAFNHRLERARAEEGEAVGADRTGFGLKVLR